MSPTASPPQADAATYDPSDPLGIFGSRVAGRFVPVRYLGRTSVAFIYRAVHALMDKPCFLKIVEHDPLSEDGLPESLRREAQTTAKQAHSSLLRMYDAGVRDGLAYLAQEWSDGPNLRFLIDQGRNVSVPDLLAIALQLLDAVCSLHARGVILRAFDPERILVPVLNGRHTLKLFDLSRILYAGERGADDASRKAAGSSAMHVRSTRYMSPEEIRERPQDHRSDLYSFGVLLAELISGEYPYSVRGRGPTAYVAGHLREEPRPLALEDRPEVPEDLPGVVRKLLAKDPAHRFQSAEETRRALEDIILPDVIRLNTPGERHVLEKWRSRVSSDLSRSRSRADPEPVGLTESEDPDLLC
ncbi:MAG: serine/threonine protein kinase [Planctomycetota bacterium]|nr:MAG: serine/threonine protein kinase [Planctomycetota bacterium]